MSYFQIHIRLGLGQGCQGVEVLDPETLYETTKLKANRRTAEPQNIECRMSNVEGWNRFAQSFIK